MKKTILATLAALFIVVPALLFAAPSADWTSFDGKTQTSLMQVK